MIKVSKNLRNNNVYVLGTRFILSNFLLNSSLKSKSENNMLTSENQPIFNILLI